MVEDAQRQRTIFPNARRQAGIGTLLGGGKTAPEPWESSRPFGGLSLNANTEKEFNKFQIRANEPEARALENFVFDTYRKQGKYPMNINSVPYGQGLLQEGWKVHRPTNVKNIEPMHHLDPNKWLPDKYKDKLFTGITNPNLGGYRVMNASDPTADGGWIDRLSRWWFGDDPEHDFQGLPPYDPDNPNHFMVPEENPPYDPDNPNHFMVPEGMDPGDIDIEELINTPRYNI